MTNATPEAVARFFNYAQARQCMLLERRAGVTYPYWTTDAILRKYRFCNVFREDDVTTAWLRTNLRDPLRQSPRVLRAVYIFRWFNRVSTAELVKDLILEGWNTVEARRRLTGVTPLVTGAYIIKTPTGMNKLEGVLHLIDQFPEELAEVMASHMRDERWSLEQAHIELMKMPLVGPFIAYELVTDLRHTTLLESAQDVHLWASPGPGAARGMSRILFDKPNVLHYTSSGDREELLQGMQYLLKMSYNAELWPMDWQRWEMRDVEHTLCEFDKYERVRLGEGDMKQLYRPTKVKP